MASIGETFRRERIKSGLELGKVANDTKISHRFLQSIEKEEFDKLPGGVFTRSFVRQYARYLGLDEAEILTELRRILEPPAEPSTQAAAQPRAEVSLPKVAPFPKAVPFEGMGSRLHPNSSLPALAMVVVVMLLCSFAYAWWQNVRRAPAPAPRQTAATAAPKPREAAPPVITAPKPEPRVTRAAEESSAPTVPAAVQAVIPAEPGGMRAALTADALTWVSATVNGKTIFAGTLQPKETKALNVPDTVKLVVGNAGGLEIQFNGKTTGPLGPRGQVRVVHLTRDGTVLISPPRPPVEDTL